MSVHLARIIDAHHALPFTRVWGSPATTSSDGQFFPSGRNAGEINAKYGPDPGLKIYSFLSGCYGSFHSNVIGATAGEAPFVLDGLVGNAAEFDPLVHYVDTGGASDHVFALFHLLGLSFAPRRRDFPDRRLTGFGRPGRWRALSALMGRPVNEEVVLEHWRDVLRLAAGIKTLSLKASSMRRKLGAYRQQNRLHAALGEIGHIERTLFMLDWIENPQLRMECQAGLSKGEARHTLARAVFAHSQGRIRDRTQDAQQKRVMGPRCTGEGVARCAEHGDKDLGLAQLPGIAIDYRDGLSGVVDKHGLPGAMGLSHHQVELAGVGSVTLTEPAVLESVGVGGLVLLPQQKQGHAFAFELAVNLCPIGLTALGTGHRRTRWIQRSFEGFVVEWCRPTHTGQSGTSEIIPDRALSDPDAECDQVLAFTGASKAQDLSYLSHGQPRCWHLAPLPCWMKGGKVRGCPTSRCSRLLAPVKSDRDGVESLTGIAWNE